jgi:hypothetical protein
MSTFLRTGEVADIECKQKIGGSSKLDCISGSFGRLTAFCGSTTSLPLRVCGHLVKPDHQEPLVLPTVW